jgi:hypothetical protein
MTQNASAGASGAPRGHKYTQYGSDGAWKMMCAGCSCGWQGPTIQGQDQKAQELAKEHWAQHIIEAYVNE